MIIQSPGDVALSIAGFEVYSYGIILAIACFVGVYTAYLLFKKFCDVKNPDCIWDIAPFVVISGIFGARLYYCLLNFSYYFSNPLEVFYMRQGGLSIHGAILAGILALYFGSRKCKVSFLKLLDSFAVGTILAQSFGRWGNFFNSEAFGFPTEGFLQLYVPPASRPPEFMGFEYFHPTFLYESVLDFVIFLVLIYVMKKFSAKIPGLTLCLYLMLYSVVRLFVEQLRIDSALNISGIPIAQIVSVVVFVVGLVSAIILIKFSKKLSNKG